ncbi:hypothetical protein IRZ71_23460 [Flavobacterium sp. ANB]|uniref:hypothetical protein n=1 Tax=unclassified Flavobacterium TaxID=196869 RepID=UPI0012B7D1D1|nr:MULTISPECIES: hypothetical protein [unclassified Flavobacterium]MBF4519316.1 hypothetical protein [Flavobacterium sp. ANB]MTD72259.1 hypothetical protein [Flavobacterium sp. LC2016-13]
MKYLTLIIAFLLFSCATKEDVLLPKSNTSIIKDVQDHSPIYIFFRTEGKDTIADVNRKNSIISTNWIFNIDKRLPLRLVIPEVIKLQEKKRGEKAHKNENAENYYSYADSLGKNLAFMPFTKVFYAIGKPATGDLVISFKKASNIVLVNNEEVKKEEVLEHIGRIAFFVKPKVYLLFDKNMSYQEYIETKIEFRKLDSYNDEIPKEFIF